VNKQELGMIDNLENEKNEEEEMSLLDQQQEMRKQNQLRKLESFHNRSLFSEDNKTTNEDGDEEEEEEDDDEKYEAIMKGKFHHQNQGDDVVSSQWENELEEIAYEGYKQGSYVKLTLSSISPMKLSNIRRTLVEIPHLPIILGGGGSGGASSEMKMGFMKCRIKRHRWQNKIFKSQDPLIISYGFYKFQVFV